MALPVRVQAESARLLVTVGEVTPTSATVWTRARDAAPLTLELRDAADAAAVATVTVTPARDRDGTARTTLTGLAPARRYRYRLSGGGDTASGEFATAPDPGTPQTVTLSWSGDLGGGGFCRLLEGGYPVFRALAARPVDFFLFVGDTIYADVPCNRPGTVRGSGSVATTLAEYHAKHRYNREDPSVQAFLRRTSVYAIWDDHEVRNDFSGPFEPLMPVGRQAFLDYWPLTPPKDEPTRLYRTVRWGRLAEIFILDTRQYRSRNGDRDGPDKTMLGAAQRAWLIEAVGGSDATWKVIVSSVPLSLPTGRRGRRDSWSNAGPFGLPEEEGTGFARERDAILRALSERGVRNLVVLTADVHHAELVRHRPTPDFAFHEFVAGPLSATHGRPRPLDLALGPTSLWARGGMNNFGEITVDAAGLTVKIVDEDGAVLVSRTVPADR